jgi:hypothetical protein
MSEFKEKQIYKIIAQNDGLTITVKTSCDITFEEAEKIAKNSVLVGAFKNEKFQPYVILPITTKERWDDRAINFCPRCGANISEYELRSFDFFDCYECDSSIQVQILHTEIDNDLSAD